MLFSGWVKNVLIENVHVGVELEVSGLVADCKVAAGHFGFGCVKAHLVASQPALITGHCRSVDCRTSEI